MNTKEGPAHVFMAYDPFPDKIFNLGVERDTSEKSILKNVYLMLEDPMFRNYHNEGYTLIMEEFEEIKDQIEAIVRPSNGKIMFDKALTNRLIQPVLKHMASYFSK